MSYLLIENKGVAEVAALTLMGASTKRSQDDRIGMFGTGNKYAISTLMRDGLQVVMFFGERRLDFEVEDVELRGEHFHQVVLISNGTRTNTNFTTEMGLKWTAENALREFVSNAIDEGDFMVAKTDELKPLAGSTRIYVGMNPDVAKFHATRDEHFLALRDTIPTYKLKGVELWPKATERARVYRRGVLCFTDEKHEGLYDYNFDDISLAEDRTASLSDAEWSFSNVMDRFPIEAKRNIISNIERDTFEAHNRYIEHRTLTSPDWKTICENKIVCSTELYDYALAGEVPRDQIIRTASGWSKALKTAGCRDIEDHLSRATLRGYMTTTMDDFELGELTAAVKFLTKTGVNISLADIKVFDTPTAEDKNLLGYWDEKEKKIYVCKACFLKGRRFVAETLFEETAHRDSGFGDKTRDFQNWLFARLLNEMEKRVGAI